MPFPSPGPSSCLPLDTAPLPLATAAPPGRPPPPTFLASSSSPPMRACVPCSSASSCATRSRMNTSRMPPPAPMLRAAPGGPVMPTDERSFVGDMRDLHSKRWHWSCGCQGRTSQQGQAKAQERGAWPNCSSRPLLAATALTVWIKIMSTSTGGVGWAWVAPAKGCGCAGSSTVTPALSCLAHQPPDQDSRAH